MELIRGLHNLRPHHRGCVATIGAFDGVHLGHQALLKQLIAKGRKLGLPSVVIIFEPLPREFFAREQAPARLTNLREKVRVMSRLGVDRLLVIRFCDRIRSMSAMEFIDHVFVEGLGIRYLVVGDDLRFGHDRQGDFSLLAKVAAERGYEVVDTDTLELGAERISSTRLRQALERADFEQARALLGRPYDITGRVIYGKQLGRTLGIPTANLMLHRYRAPLSGVFAVEVSGAGDAPVPGVANVGTRPTVDGIKALLEVHLFDWQGSLYGKTISVAFLKKLREEQKFGSIEELKMNIERDIKNARAHFGL